MPDGKHNKVGSNKNDILCFHGAFIFQVHSMSAHCSLTSLGQEILASCYLFYLEACFRDVRPFGTLQALVTGTAGRARPAGVGAAFLQTCAPDPREAASLLRPFIIYNALQVYTAFSETQRQGPCPTHHPAFHVSEPSRGDTRQAGGEPRAMSAGSGEREGF